MRSTGEYGTKGRGWRMTLGAALAALAVTATALAAQETGGQLGRIVVGFRQIEGEHGSSKFTEYQQRPNGLFVQDFEFRQDNLFGRNFFLNMQTRSSFEDQMTHLLSLGTPGKFRFDFVWAQTPHDFTNAAHSFFASSSPGVLTVPAAIRTDLTSKPGDLPGFLSSAGFVDASLERKRGTGTFTFTPKEAMTLRLQYSLETEFGTRPLGTALNSFTNMTELPEPIDYRTHELKATAEYADHRRPWVLQAGYTGSFFQNRVSSLTWDNPFRTADGAASGQASHGRLALYPDNRAQSFSLAGAWNLSASTRLVASVTPGWMYQNEPFLPFTINNAISGVSPLPAASLNGQKQTLAMNYTLTNTSLAHWTLTARYRSYDYNNDTPSLAFQNYVATDTRLSAIDHPSEPFGYNRKNLGLDASWQLARTDYLKFSYEWERMGRQYREVEVAKEHTAGVSFNSLFKKWITVRTSYYHSERQPQNYEGAEDELRGLRKFDEASRGRDHAELLLQLDPTPAWSFSFFGGNDQSRYHDSLYGRLKDFNLNFGTDIIYSPRPEYSLFAEYSRENQRYSQRSRQRTAANDIPLNDWGSTTRDLTDTWAAGVSASLFRNRFQSDSFYSVSWARGAVATQALGQPGTGFLVTTATNYPNTDARIQQLVTTVRFRLSQYVYPRLEYRFEKYGRADYQIDRISPYMVPLDSSTGTSVFLGAQVPGYKAHVFSFGLEYHF